MMETKAKKVFKKGMARTSPYNAWVNMKQACNDAKHAEFDRAGGKGLGYVATWSKFEGFWLSMRATWRPGARLHRYDTSLSYYKANCYWKMPAGKRPVKEDPNNKFGVRGMVRYVDCAGYVSWMVRHTVDGHRVSKVFSWNAYGEHKAFMLALEYIASFEK